MPDNHENEIIHRDIDTNTEEPATEVATAIAEIEGKVVTDLTNMWECIDHVLDHIFSNPPSREAQMQVEFTYEGYRVTVEQNGSAKFIEIG